MNPDGLDIAEPGTLVRVSVPGVLVGIGEYDAFRAEEGDICIVLGRSQILDDDERRRAIDLLIRGTQGWLWEDEIEFVDEAG